MLKQDGWTMIIITHEMAFAKGASDTVAFLSGGTIAEMGTPKQLFDNPVTDELKRFLRFGP